MMSIQDIQAVLDSVIADLSSIERRAQRSRARAQFELVTFVARDALAFALASDAEFLGVHWTNFTRLRAWQTFHALSAMTADNGWKWVSKRERQAVMRAMTASKALACELGKARYY